MQRYKKFNPVKQQIQKLKEQILSAVTEFDANNPDDQQILRISIASELSAINLYRTLAELTKNKLIKKALLDITKEEKTHVSEFETILREIDSEQTIEDINGKNEIEDMKESRIIYPNEKIMIDNKLSRPGDFVYHYKFGIGRINAIDLKTYSVPMITFEPNNINDEIYRPYNEFKQLTVNQHRQLGKIK